jgi:hypothetical protein
MRIFRGLLVFHICFLGKNFKRVARGIKGYQNFSFPLASKAVFCAALLKDTYRTNTPLSPDFLFN